MLNSLIHWLGKQISISLGKQLKGFVCFITTLNGKHSWIIWFRRKYVIWG